MEKYLIFFFTVQTFVTCYGRDASVVYTVPHGGCPHHELDNLRPNTTYRVTVTTVIPGRSAPQVEVQTFVSDPAPFNTLKAWNVGSNEFSVFWLPGNQLLKQDFTVQILNENNVISATDPLEDVEAVNDVQVNNLLPATLYEIQVLQSAQVIASTRIVTRPRPPTLLTLTRATTTSLTLQWSAPLDNVNHYEVCYHPPAGIATSKVHFRTEIELLNLMPGTIYTFSVTAITQINGATAASTMLYGFYKTVSDTNPATPERLEVTSINQNSVTLSWDLPLGSAEAFELDYMPQFGYPPPPIRIPPFQQSIQLNFLQSSTNYQFSLTSTKGRKLSRIQSGAVEASVVTDDGIFNVEVFNIRDTSAKLLYGYEQQAVMYSLMYGPQAETKVEEHIAANIPRQYSLLNLRPGTLYAIDILALDVNGETINQQSKTFMTLFPPSVTPTILQFTPTSSTLSFPLPSEDLTDFDHYEVQLHFGGDTSFGARINDVIIVPKSACPSLEFEDLRPDSLYEVVTSVVSGSSKTVGTVVGVSTAPLGPLEISAALVTSSSIEIVWGSGTEDFTEYELTYTTTSSSAVSITLLRGTNRHVLDNLQPGTMYVVTLTKLGGDVIDSNTVQLTTRPLPPTNLRETTVWTQSALFSWNSPHNMFSVCYFPQGNSPNPWTTSLTDVMLTGFQPETSVMVTVVAMSQIQLLSYRSDPVTIEARTLSVEPGEIQVDGFTTTTIDVSWIGLPGNNQYRVDYFNIKTPSVVISEIANTVEYSITGLDPGELYNISVVPDNTEFPPSSTVQRTLPNPPGDVRVIHRDVTAITLMWQEPAQTEDYEFLVKIFDLRGQTIRQVRVSSLRESFSDLMAGTNFTFAVSTVTGMGVFETVSVSRDVNSGTLLSMQLTAGQRQLIIEWDPVDYGQFSFYEITYSVIDDRQFTNTVTLSNTLEEISIENLIPGSRIHVSIDIIKNLGHRISVGVNQTVLVPLEVSNLAYTARRTEISLTWDLDSLFFDGFEISHTPMDGLLPAGNITGAFGARIVGLTPGQEYTVYVTTLSNGQRSKPVQIVVITLPERIPFLDLYDVGEGILSITWEEPEMRGLPINQYTVTITASNNGPPDTLVSDPSQSTILTYEGQPGFYYTVEIISVVVGKSGMQKSESNQEEILMTPSRPNFKTLSEGDVGATFVSLSWTIRGARSYYEVKITSDLNNNAKVVRIEPWLTSTRLGDFVPLTSYYVTILAVSEFQVEDGDLYKAAGEFDSVSFTTKPFAPRNLSTTFIGKKAITWMWLPPVSITYYAIYRVELIGSTGSRVQILSGTTSFEAVNLTPETKYTLRIQAQLGELLSLPVENTAATLRQRPSAINGFGISDTTKPSPEIKFVWDAVNPEDKVTLILIKINGLQKGGDGEDSRTENISSTATSYIVTKLFPGYSYNFSICAVNECGSSEPATEGPILIPKTAPPATKNRVKIISTTSKTITVGIKNPFFSDINGPIVNYALLVTRGSDEDVVGPIPNTYLESQKFENNQPPYQATPQFYDPYRIQSRDGSGLFQIGSDKDCLLISNFPEDEYCNGPLQPSTTYWVALRGYGIDGSYKDSPWSEPAFTGYNTVLVAVIVTCFLLLMLILMMVLCCILCCCKSKRNSRPKRRRLHPENRQTSSDATSLENFRLPGDDDSSQNGGDSRGVLMLTSYRKKKGAVSNKKYKKKKKSKSRHRRRDRPGTSTMSLDAESTVDDRYSTITTLATTSSNPIVNSMFQNHVANMSSPDNVGFVQEFQNMEALPTNMTTEVAKRPENMRKNRYRDVLAYDATRVVLLEPANNRSDYINANHIQWFDWGRYISAQGPIPDTLQDFWQMIWENKSTTIVMLTKLVEGGSTRCEKYWPDHSETMTFGNFEVTATGVKMEEKWQITKMQVKKNDVTLQVNHYHFLNWPDRGIPINPKPLLEFIKEVRKVERTNLGPLLVHCSAGCGRSGTFIALDILMKKLETSTVNDKTNVLETVYTLRQQRMKMVQNSDQYAFLHRCLGAYIHELFYSGRSENRPTPQR